MSGTLGISSFSATAGDSTLTFSWDVCANLLHPDNISKITIYLNDFGGSPIVSYPVKPVIEIDEASGLVNGITKSFTITEYNGAALKNGVSYGASILISDVDGASHSYSLSRPIKPLSIPVKPEPHIYASESKIHVSLKNFTQNADANSGFSPITNIHVYLSNTDNESFVVYTFRPSDFGANFGGYKQIDNLDNGSKYEVAVAVENALGVSPISDTVEVEPSDLPGTIVDKVAVPTLVFDASKNIKEATILFGYTDDTPLLSTNNIPVQFYQVYRFSVDGSDVAIDTSKSLVQKVMLDASGVSLTPDLSYNFGAVNYPFKVSDSSVVLGTKYVYGIAGTNSNGEGVMNYTHVMRAGVTADAPSVTLTPTDGDVLANAVKPAEMGGFLPRVTAPDASGVVQYFFRYTWSYLDASNIKQVVSQVTSAGKDVSSGMSLVNGRTYTVEAEAISQYESVYYYGAKASANSVPYGQAPAPTVFDLFAVNSNGPLNGALDASWNAVTNKNGSTGDITYSILVADVSGVMQVFASGIRTTTYQLTGLTNGETYEVKVRADVMNSEINETVAGIKSVSKSATPFALPTDASGLTLTRLASDTITFAFDACANSTGLGLASFRSKVIVQELSGNVYTGVSSEYLIQGNEIKSITYSGVTGKSYEFAVTTGVSDETNNIYYNKTSQIRQATMYGIPDAPNNFAVVALNNGFRVTWDEPSNLRGTKLSGYRIVRGIAPGYTTVATLGTEVEYYVAEGYANNTPVNVSIFSIASAEYETSEILSAALGPIAVIPNPAPGFAQNLTASGSDSQVSLTWTRDNDVVGYQITQDDNPTYERAYALGDGSGWTFGVNVVTFIAPNLVNGTQYTFKVSSYKMSGTSKIYSIDSSVPAVPFAAPTAPTNLICSVASQSISSTWNAPSSTAGAGLGDNGPLLYRLVIDASYTDMSGATQIPNTKNVLDQDGISLVDIPYIFSGSSLNNGKSYLVKVQAYFVNNINQQRYPSAFTSPVLVIPNPPPQDVSDLTIVPGNNQNVLSWVNPTDTSSNLYPRTKIEIYSRVDATTGTGSAYGVETKIADLSPDVTTYTASNLLNGALYRYKVVSIHSSPAQQPAGAVITGMPFGKAVLVSATPNTSGSSTYSLTINKNGSNLLDYVAIGALPDGSGNISIPVLQGTVPVTAVYSGASGATFAANQFYTLTINMVDKDNNPVNVDAVLVIIENGAGFITRTIPTGVTTTFGRLPSV
jgi:hypothetical protein